MSIGDVQESVQVLKKGSVWVKVRKSGINRRYGELRDKQIEYRQTNQMVWQIRETYQGGWKDFANELTSEETVRDLIKKEYDVRY